MVLTRFLEAGFSFGLTSGIITTLGLMVGLNAGTSSQSIVAGGILTIAIADAMSDALGMHVSEESENKYTDLQIWAATITAFAGKFLTALTFVVPVLLLPLSQAVIVSIVWGMVLLGALNFFIARQERKNFFIVIGEHWVIALLVILATNWVGNFISGYFT